ncbi:unnamed protein product [Ectocarpus sp. 12 AP-2014]
MKVHPERRSMSGKEAEVETIDLEAFDSPGDIFENAYGSETMTQAKENQERLARLSALKPNGGRSFRPVDPGLKVTTNARLSQFENEKIYENDWQNSVLDLMEDMLRECTESSDAHAAAARKCRAKHRVLTIPAILVATAATSASFFAAGGNPCGDGEDDKDPSLKYVVASLTALVAIMSGVGSLYNFKAKMEKHISASGAFANLARRAKIIIFLPLKLKPNCEVALTDISAEQAHLTSSSPLL